MKVFFSFKKADGNNFSLKAFLSILCGFFSAMAFPPFNLWPLIFIFTAPVIRMSFYESSALKAFRLGFLFALAYFGLVLHWIVNTVNSFGNIGLLPSFAALGLLASYLSLYPALFFSLINLLGKKLKKTKRESFFILLLMAALWVALEYLRAFLLTGFPWAQLAYSLAGQSLLIQGADLGGAYLISFFIICFNLCFAFYEKIKKNTALLLILLIPLASYTCLRLDFIERETTEAKKLNVSVLQANMSPIQKWDPSFQKATIDTYRDLVFKSDIREDHLFVWPETALPFYLFKDKELSSMIFDLVKESKSYHLIGSPAYSKVYNKKNRNFDYSFFNTSYLLDPSAKLIARYDKVHLVPFGEYTPLRKHLPFLASIVNPVAEFSEGRHPPLIKLKEDSLTPLICFESVFSPISRQGINLGAKLLSVQTNDAWFGNTGGPHQHFDFSVFRAIEYRRSLVRSANTGISALILPSGKIEKQGPLNLPLSLDFQAPLVEVSSFYARFGDLFAISCFFILVFTIFYIYNSSFKTFWKKILKS